MSRNFLKGDASCLTCPGFVIRPKGNWSMDYDKMGETHFKPFGKVGKDTFFKRGREGVFDWDWEALRKFSSGWCGTVSKIT